MRSEVTTNCMKDTKEEELRTHLNISWRGNGMTGHKAVVKKTRRASLWMTEHKHQRMKVNQISHKIPTCYVRKTKKCDNCHCMHKWYFTRPPVVDISYKKSMLDLMPI